MEDKHYVDIFLGYFPSLGQSEENSGSRAHSVVPFLPPGHSVRQLLHMALHKIDSG
jgi:hypothetical protein